MLETYHGKAIALDRHRYVPFPAVFIIHEQRVRGYHIFQPERSDIPDDPPWQDWIIKDSVFDKASNSFLRDEKSIARPSSHAEGEVASHFHPFETRPPASGDQDSKPGHLSMALNDEVIAEILAASRTLPSWKSCVVEGTSWSGTAEENIEKYRGKVGVDEENETRDDQAGPPS